MLAGKTKTTAAINEMKKICKEKHFGGEGNETANRGMEQGDVEKNQAVSGKVKSKKIS